VTDSQTLARDPGKPPPLVSTWDVLHSLGFTDDRALTAGAPGGLQKQFGNFTLSAIHCISLRFQPVVILSGVMTTPRTVTQVECEMPQELESWEVGAAWVTWCLDNHARGEFQPTIPTPWLSEGRQHRRLLPWVREREARKDEQAAYAARLRCFALREWARLALRTLAEQLAEMTDDAPVTFRFDGEVLTIRCGGELIALAATGEQWPGGFSLPAHSLRALPKRFTHRSVEFAVFGRALIIDNQRYRDVAEVRLAWE
jgi:hypothetical protein